MKLSRRLKLGSAWYPEQWDPSVWREDVGKMRALGFNVARVGEFAWAKLEPREGHYDLDWMEAALDLLEANEIGAILCTPTATPPRWLLRKHPDIGYVEADGYRYGHGARQHASYNSAVFREHSRKITDVIAKRFGGHPALHAWQIDNELGSHQHRCFSDESIARWHQWLRARYGKIEQLNEAWKTVVWSHVYNSFEDVQPPYRLHYYTHNLALKLNYRRFMTEMIAEFQAEQVEIIRQYSALPVTHNSTSHQCERRLSQHLDFPSMDVYAHNNTAVGMMYRFDAMRNITAARQFYTMETGPEDQLEGELYRPGWIGCFSFLNYCMGATGLCFWPWRQQPGGSEIMNPSILHGCGKPSSGWNNVTEANDTREQLDSILQTFRPARADVALITSDYNGRFYYEDGAGGLEANFNYKRRREECYQALVELNVWRDVVYDEADFGCYDLLYSPYLPHVKTPLIDKLLPMVEAGSTWVVGPYSGYLTEDFTVPEQAIFGELESRLGFQVKYLVARAGELAVDIQSHQGTTSQMATIFEAREGDEVIGTYRGERFAGQPWGVAYKHGAGQIILLGSHVDPLSYRKVWQWILARSGVLPKTLPPGLVSVPLVEDGGSQRMLGFCNLSRTTCKIPVEEDQVVVSSKDVSMIEGKLFMPSHSWGILQ